ncbi:Gldg family protein [Thermococcus pacificus]|uniref:IFT52 GIFT domain-containing protein n=1 Tax=Thermococcus pacificus TaxID=71998 RepID=A0A218P8J9_9EURY|nr:Gldg family protein [Thermococcus pacificus]ASJ07109.1 hypothetical protein A3L08_07125 [Thermococcus pacificus]
MRKSAMAITLILILSLIPTWAVKPVKANDATYVPLIELNQNFDEYAYNGDILTRGIVTYVDNSGFAIQNGTGPYTGIYVYTGYNSHPAVTPGDLVEVYGFPKYYDGLRELSVNPRYGEYYNVVGSAEVPEPVVIPTADYDKSEYQSVLVKFVDAKIIDRYDRGYTKLWIDDGSGEAYVFSYSSLPSDLQPGAKFKYLTGLVYVYRNSYEVIPLSWELYNPAVKITNVEYYAIIQGVSSPVWVTVKNEGDKDTTVDLKVLLDGVLLHDEQFELGLGKSKEITVYVLSNDSGMHTLSIFAEGSSIELKTWVIPAPHSIAYGLTYYYERRYNEFLNQILPLYENMTFILQEFDKCGVNLGDIEPEIQIVHKLKEEMDLEHQIYTKLNQKTSLKNPYLGSSYYFAVMIHARKASLSAEKLLNELNFVVPVLWKNYNVIMPICNPPAEEQPSNETVPSNESEVTPGNETIPSNQTNMSPSMNITITIPKVLIDASHGQYYNPTKTDQSGLSTLINNIKNELGWIVDVNTETITYEKLQEYDVLIITNPTDDISDEEAQAIQEFVENGGGLFILGDWYKYANTENLNAIVGKYGIKFNADELMDDEQNSGRPYYPFVGIYNKDHPAMKFVPDDWTMYYNGQTLTIGGSAVWLIKAYDTGYSVDADGNVVFEKGSEPVIAAAVEVGTGRIIAYGSSKALSDSYYNKYIDSNWPFIKGALLWLAHQE